MALHFVPMGAHFVYMGAQCTPNGLPWAQNVGLRLEGRLLSSALLCSAMGWGMGMDSQVPNAGWVMCPNSSTQHLAHGRRAV